MSIDSTYPDDVNELAEDLLGKDRMDTRHSGVYIIYDGKTGEALYVGQAKNVHQRLYDHHDARQTDLRPRVEKDPNFERPTSGGNMWEWTEWAWVEVEGGESKRREVEELVEKEVEPRYSSL